MKSPLLACALALLLSAVAHAEPAQQAQPQAQQAPAYDDTMVGQVQHLISADWRPVALVAGTDPQPAFQSACTGAADEITALHNRLRPNMTVSEFRQIRNEHGLIIMPGHTPSSVVFFPNAELNWVAGGMGSLLIVDIDHSVIELRDSSGGVLRAQLAQAAGQAIMRVVHDDHVVALYVACIPTAQ